MDGLGPRQLARLRGAMPVSGASLRILGARRHDHGQGTTRRTATASAEGRTTGGGESCVEEASAPGWKRSRPRTGTAHGGAGIGGHSGRGRVFDRGWRGGAGPGRGGREPWGTAPPQSRRPAQRAGTGAGQSGAAGTRPELRFPLRAIGSALDCGNDGGGGCCGRGAMGADPVVNRPAALAAVSPSSLVCRRARR